MEKLKDDVVEPMKKANRNWRRILLIASAFLVCAIGTLAALYSWGPQLSPGDPACQAAVDIAQRVKSFTKGGIPTIAIKGIRIPELTIVDARGREHQLSEWRGRLVLFSSSAWWCVPCMLDLRQLDELQKKMGGPEFEVIVVNIDTRDPEHGEAYFRRSGISNLAYYADPEGKKFDGGKSWSTSSRLIRNLSAIDALHGIPESILIDPQGCEIAHWLGSGEWASDDVVTLFKVIKAAFIKGAAPAVEKSSKGWGAFALGTRKVPSKVAIGIVNDRKSEVTAKADALAACEAKGLPCTIRNTWNGGCGFATTGRVSRHEAVWGVGPTPEVATAECKKAGATKCATPEGDGCK